MDGVTLRAGILSSSFLFIIVHLPFGKVYAVPNVGKKRLSVNTGKSNLEITDLQVFNSALGVQLKKRVLKPGASTKMKITAYGKFLKKVKGSPRVLMITNDPNCPKIIINVNVTAK